MVCRVEGRTVGQVSAGSGSCALQVVLSPAGVEGEVRWTGDPRAGGRQSVNKQIASLLNSGRVEGRDRPRAGGMLRARCCSCSRSTAQMLMQGVRGAGGRAGQGSLSVGPRPAPGSWQAPWSPAAVSNPLSSELAAPTNVNPGAWDVLSRRLRARPPHQLVLN